MDVDISTTPTTMTGPSEVSSTLGGGSSTLVNGSGDNTPTIVYILLGVGATAPVVLLLTIAVVLRSRRAVRRAVLRRATYNSAPTVDAVIDAWNSSVTGGTPNSKPTGATDGRSSRSNLTAGGGQEPGILSELAVREFFDVQDRQACQLYVSVEPSEGPRSAKSGAASVSTAASSTPGSGDWSGSSEISGVMERRVEDLVALIGPVSTTTKKVPESVVTITENAQLQTSSDDAPLQCVLPILTTDSTVVESVPDSSLKHGHNGSYPSTNSGPTVHTVVVDVEPTRVNGLADETGYAEKINHGVDHDTRPLSGLSKMRRSEACYDIAHLSASSPVNGSDGIFESSSKSSSPLPSLVPPTSDASYSWTDTEAEPTEDLNIEEQQALQCLDSIAYDYADNEDFQEPTVKRSKL